jgi:hypothetical protein
VNVADAVTGWRESSTAADEAINTVLDMLRAAVEADKTNEVEE